ncbi:unnamed protein product, partial [Mesorhabditis belari]|uniref:DEUBAD domain-containing protein n=1 Tax=Mesorhabditis belari TaxID=2138241 RepID=A0AAF3FGY6_9BILA
MIVHQLYEIDDKFGMVKANNGPRTTNGLAQNFGNGEAMSNGNHLQTSRNLDEAGPSTSRSTSTSGTGSTSVSSACSTPQDPDLPLEMSKLNLGGELILVPTVLVISEGAFRSIINHETFMKLPEAAKKHLMTFLPQSERPEDNEETLKKVFTKSPRFNFGNPVGKFHAKLKGGHFGTERPSERVQLKDDQRVLYDHYIRFYHINLLKKLLVSRHALLQHFISTPTWEDPGPVPVDPVALRKRDQYARIQARAAKRSRLMLGDCRARVGETGVSSDEEPDEDVLAAPTKIIATPAGRSTLYAAHHRDMDLYQPLYIDDVKTMQKKFKKLRKAQPHTPSLDITGIHLDDVLERSGVQSVSERIRQTKETLENMS